MVGVLRSKACNACRARRKKCDEERPTCGACLKRGAKCVYRKDINFIFYQPQSTDASDVDSDNLNSSDSSTSPESTDASTDVRSFTRQSTPFSFASDHPAPLDLPHSVLRAANSSRAHGFFLDEYLPKYSRSLALNSSTESLAASAWYKRCGSLAASDQLLNDAMLALSLKHAEEVHKAPELAFQGALIYGRLVKNISHRLNDPVESLSDSTLAAVMALTTWETQSATRKGAHGWLSHVRGAQMLVQLRGASNFATEFGRDLYLGSLLSNLISAIGSRKAIPFVTPSDPNVYDGDFASYAKLFGVLHALPGILEQCDIVIAAANSKASHSEILKKSSIMSYLVRDFESRLSGWSAQFVETLEDPLFWQAPSILAAQLPPDSPDRIFTYFNCFRSLDIGHQLVFSWSCHLLANLALATCVMALKENGYTNVTAYATDFDMSNIFRKLYKLAIDILVSFEYFLHPDMGQTGIDFLGLPVNLVYGFMMNKNFSEVRWFKVLFDRMWEMNPGFAAFLQAMAEQGGGGRAFKLLVQESEQTPLVHHAYSDTPTILA